MRIREIPPSDRPREKLAAHGAACLTDAELLAIFLRTGVKGKSAITLASELLRKKGSLRALSRSSAGELAKAAPGIGPAKAAELAAAFELGKRLARGGAERPVLDSAAVIYETFGAELQARDREVASRAVAGHEIAAAGRGGCCARLAERMYRAPSRDFPARHHALCLRGDSCPQPSVRRSCAEPGRQSADEAVG